MMFLKTVICTVMQIMHNLYKYSTHACFSQTYMCTGTHVHHDAYILYCVRCESYMHTPPSRRYPNPGTMVLTDRYSVIIFL